MLLLPENGTLHEAGPDGGAQNAPADGHAVSSLSIIAIFLVDDFTGEEEKDNASKFETFVLTFRLSQNILIYYNYNIKKSALFKDYLGN